MILNASPRAPKSNSKSYAEIFIKNCSWDTEYFNLTKNIHPELCAKAEHFSDLLLVFPLYADGIPVTLLNFFKTLEQNPPQKRPVISLIINCGFLEAWQNDVALQIVKLFCQQNGYVFGSALKIGSGEAILATPFKWLVISKTKKLAASIINRKYRVLQTTMPLPKKTFIKASTSYWLNYGKKNGISRTEMETMQIE